MLEKGKIRCTINRRTPLETDKSSRPGLNRQRTIMIFLGGCLIASVAFLLCLFNSSFNLNSYLPFTLNLSGSQLQHQSSSSDMTQLQQNFAHRNILPETVFPKNYDLYIKPNLNTFTFEGRASILVQFLESVDQIVLNAADLVFKSASLEKVSATSIVIDEKPQRVTFQFPTKISKGQEQTLEIHFSGVISEKLAGFYRSAYKDSQGVEKYMAVTQFEPTDARQAFPCWDEPNKKATFDITLEVEDKYTALSNMDIISTTPSEEFGWKVVKYSRTPIMSTYLIAFAIGEIESIETTTKSGIPVRVWAPLGYVHQGKFSLDVGARTLDFFSDYFEQPYPLPKMDMIAVPDFASGAMENWGLVTYRMTLLLFDETSSTLSTKERVAYVVGHELAHQWFGNLVTMEWWSDLWLNEGFATWVGWLASDHLFPEWNIWTRFVLEDLASGLSLDALRSSHPIEVPVKDPSDITQIFDSISYSKGASVIRMLEAYLGREVFRDGLRSYLQKHKFGNAKTSDLWNSLENASNKPVNTIMSDWTLQMGYPLLTIKSVTNSDATLPEATTPIYSVEQHRFLSSGDVKSEEDQLVWHVPLNFLTKAVGEKKAQLKSLLLSERIQSLAIPRDLSFLKLNPGQTGFYRVQYPDALLDQLGKSITILTVEDRIGLLNDAFVLGTSGYSSSVKALNLLSYIKTEDEYVVWAEVASQLGKIKSVWFEEEKGVQDDLKALVRSLVSPVARQLGWTFQEGEPDSISQLRTLTIPLAANNGDEELLAEARIKFERFITGQPDEIHPNLRGSIFALNVKFGGSKEYEAVLEIYKNTKVADQKTAALSALTASRDIALINRTLEMSLQESEVRPQDIIYIFRNIISNEVARRPTWQFVKTNWARIYEKFAGGSISLLSSIVSASTGSLTTLKDAEDIEDFFKDKETASFSRVIAQSIEKVIMAARWLERDRQPIADWLKEQKGIKWN